MSGLIHYAPQLLDVREPPVRVAPKGKVFAVGQGLFPGHCLGVHTGIVLPHETSALIRYSLVAVILKIVYKTGIPAHTAHVLGAGLDGQLVVAVGEDQSPGTGRSGGEGRGRPILITQR